MRYGRPLCCGTSDSGSPGPADVGSDAGSAQRVRNRCCGLPWLTTAGKDRVAGSGPARAVEHADEAGGRRVLGPGGSRRRASAARRDRQAASGNRQAPAAQATDGRPLGPAARGSAGGQRKPPDTTRPRGWSMAIRRGGRILGMLVVRRPRSRPSNMPVRLRLFFPRRRRLSLQQDAAAASAGRHPAGPSLSPSSSRP